MKIQFFLVLLFLLVTNTAYCCSVLREPTTVEKFEQADHVVIAKITSTRLVLNEEAEDEYDREFVEATYEVIEQLKGDSSPPIARELVYGPGNCMMGLLTGSYYVFFLEGEERFAGWPGGSFMTWNLEATQVVPVLEELRKLSARNINGN